MSHDVHADHFDAPGTDVFGFWLYILTDCIVFASLFATYVVLNHPGAYGPALKDYIHLPYVFYETLFLLASNFSFGLAMISFYKKDRAKTKMWLALTFILGACFVGMEINEFIDLVHEGYSFKVSGAASAFFTLVGCHGLHVSFGLLWILVAIVQLSMKKLDGHMEKPLVMLGIFWNFLDIVWIFVFTVVYLIGAL